MNINVGVLGHVDSGKTTICKSLSTSRSTAAFDSNPQSQERGITLDLGFSSFESGPDYKWNFTLVDCPGHSSLIRTVIGGAQIMDIMLLVVDINKGMQAQTAECLILAQIASDHLVVVLNKVDWIDDDKRADKITKVTKLMRTTLSKTKFGDAQIVPVSGAEPDIGTDNLKAVLVEMAEKIEFFRDKESPFLMAVDHCFTIRGQGTVVTGTILQGVIAINDTVEFPSISEQKKVKSMQSCHVPITDAAAGDRVGICFPGLNASQIERTIICAPKLVSSSVRAGIINIERIQYFKKPIVSQKKYHVSIGYCTITARVIMFHTEKSITSFDPALEYTYVEALGEATSSKSTASGCNTGTTFAVLEFDTPTMLTPKALVIGSDLQSGAEGVCRLAFHGRIHEYTEDKLYKTTFLPQIKAFREKFKDGRIDRIQSDNVLIVKNFCTKESKIDHLINLKLSVHLPKEVASDFVLNGRIESRFGQTIKVRVVLDEPMTSDQVQILKPNVSKAFVMLRYKRFIFFHEKGKLFQGN